ncbi:MAG: alpha-glucan family phosphorylase [Bacteroidota bacterium]
MSTYSQWHHPYDYHHEYSKRVAYFSMEFAIDQALKIYSGGLGFLAGSHMRSAFELKQNLIGVGMLWKFGYYDQQRSEDNSLRVTWTEKRYSFLEDTGITVKIRILDNPNVHVRAYCLKPETFGSVPIYLLSTDLPENDHLTRTITDKLYDNNELTRQAQSIVLGIGGAKVVEALGGSDIYHLNEGHGLPAFFHLKEQGKTKDNFVFTTHTPEKAGNEERDIKFLNEMGFFAKELDATELSQHEHNGMLSYTVAALRKAKISNAVSKLHSTVAKDMWSSFNGISDIIPITNAQNRNYWQDAEIKQAVDNGDLSALKLRKRELKEQLFARILDETGKFFDPDVLTIVWARRFAGYKRADLLLYLKEQFNQLVSRTDKPVQIIWAGKPYPLDYGSVELFNHLIHLTKPMANCTVLTGYELALSKLLKQGSDIWLNTPRVTREASGTSGMTAAMNGSVNVSTNDGWMPEFARDNENSFITPQADLSRPQHEIDHEDANNLYTVLNDKVLPTYYDDPGRWWYVARNSAADVVPQFDSHRMADQYYKEMFN